MGAKGFCRVCHHRADQHYPTPEAEQNLAPGMEPSRVAWCHHEQGGGVCGCVGKNAAAKGDRKQKRRN